MVGELAGVTKRFRGITALDGVDLGLEAGRSPRSSARTVRARRRR